MVPSSTLSFVLMLMMSSATALPVHVHDCELGYVTLVRIDPATLRVTNQAGGTADDNGNSLDDVKIGSMGDYGRDLILEKGRRYTIAAKVTCCAQFELIYGCGNFGANVFFKETYDLKSIPDGTTVRWEITPDRTGRVSYVDGRAARHVVAPALAAGNRSGDIDGPKVVVDAELDGKFIRVNIRADDPSGVRSISYSLIEDGTSHVYTTPFRIDPDTTLPDGTIIATDNRGNKSGYSFSVSGTWRSGTILP